MMDSVVLHHLYVIAQYHLASSHNDVKDGTSNTLAMMEMRQAPSENGEEVDVVVSAPAAVAAEPVFSEAGQTPATPAPFLWIWSISCVASAGLLRNTDSSTWTTTRRS